MAKKSSYKEFDIEKNSCGSKIPLPPHNISNGPSLRLVYNQSQSKTIKTNQTCILYFNDFHFQPGKKISFLDYHSSCNIIRCWHCNVRTFFICDRFCLTTFTLTGGG